MNVHFIIAVFHIIVVVPFLLYIFHNRASNPEWIYTTLLVVGIFVLLYHTYKSIIKYIAKSPSLWVNIYHVVGLAPLLIYIGYKGKKTERPAYEVLGILGFGALGYHLYNLIMMLQNLEDDSDNAK
jgi:hypothetical protein